MAGNYIVGLVLGACLSFATVTFAADAEQRFDSGPLFSEADAFITASCNVLNDAENSLYRLKALALVQRVAGGRARQEHDLAQRDPDELARFFIMSIDSWLAAGATHQYVQTFRREPKTRGLASALETGICRFADGSEIRAPLSQRIVLYHGDILVLGEELLKRGVPKRLAGEYTAAVNGACAFDDGPIKIVQDQFLLEGQREDRLLFWGAVGDTRAYFATAENKFLKISLRRGGEHAQVEFPDKASELFSASLNGPVLSLRGEFFESCDITLTPRHPVPESPGDEITPTRLVREPPEPIVERIDTPGVSLTMRETGRTGSGRKLEVTYQWVAQGFAPESTYSLWRFRPQAEPLRILGNLTVDEWGVMIVNECDCGGGEWTPGPLETVLPITIDTIAAGEAFEFGILSDDMSVGAYATVFPVPLEVTDGDCRLVLERLNPGQTVYRAHVTGLVPNEALRIESGAEGTVLHGSGQADARGKFSAYVFPEVLGMRYGRADYRVYAESCGLQIDFQWGVHPGDLLRDWDGAVGNVLYGARPQGDGRLG